LAYLVLPCCRNGLRNSYLSTSVHLVP
jgi:hypothetical protein